MSFSLFSIVILFIFAVICTIEIHKGRKQGFCRSLVSFGVTVTALLISVMLAPSLGKWAAQWISYFAFGSVNAYTTMLGNVQSVKEISSLLIEMIVGSVLFIGLFFALRAVLNIVTALILKRLAQRYPDIPLYKINQNSYIERHDRGLATLVGGVSAILVAMAMISPFMGTFDLLHRTANIVSNATGKEQTISLGNLGKLSLGKSGIEDIERYSNDFVGNVFYQCGGKLIYRDLVSTRIDGKKVSLVTEIETVEELITKLPSVMSVLKNPKEATKKQAQGLYDLCDDVETLELTSGILSDAMKSWASAWSEGRAYMGMYRPAMNEFLDPTVDKVLEVCQSCTRYSAKQNMITLVKIYAVVLESGIIGVNTSDSKVVFSCLTQSNLLERMDQVFAENPHMAGINVTSIAMSAMTKYLQLPKNFDEVKYEQLMGNIADAINSVNTRGYATKEEKQNAMIAYAKEHIGTYGIEMPDVIGEAVAEELLNSATFGTVRAEDIREIFDNYVR